MDWHRVADRLHLPVKECKKRLSSMDFVLQLEYLEQDLNGFHRNDYFLAQIAHMLAMANSKDPKAVKFDTFLMKFDKKKPEVEASEELIKNKMAMSRGLWGAMLGVQIPIDDLLPEEAEDEEPAVIRGPWEDE